MGAGDASSPVRRIREMRRAGLLLLPMIASTACAGGEQVHSPPRFGFAASRAWRVGGRPVRHLIPPLRHERSGVVLVALIYGSASTALPQLAHNFPVSPLPLRLKDATPRNRWEGLPGANLPHLRLTARVHGELVEVDAYFGERHPSAARRAAADRELRTLTGPAGSAEHPLESRWVSHPSGRESRARYLGAAGRPPPPRPRRALRARTGPRSGS